MLDCLILSTGRKRRSRDEGPAGVAGSLAGVSLKLDGDEDNLHLARAGAGIGGGMDSQSPLATIDHPLAAPLAAVDPAALAGQLLVGLDSGGRRCLEAGIEARWS